MELNPQMNRIICKTASAARFRLQDEPSSNADLWDRKLRFEEKTYFQRYFN
jgi:hypothetical protein